MSERERLESVYRGYSSDPRRVRSWSIENPGNRAIRSELASALLKVLPHEGPILDAGCGTGWWFEHLLATGVAPERLHAVELIQARIDAARARAPGAHIRHGDAAALPWPDNHFAIATLLTVLSSTTAAARQRRILDEALRVSSLVVVWEPRWPNPRNSAVSGVRRALAAHRNQILERQTLTLAPPLARRVTPAAYRRLARIAALRSHTLTVLTGQAWSAA